jgi:hypothetical protein
MRTRNCGNIGRLASPLLDSERDPDMAFLYKKDSHQIANLSFARIMTSDSIVLPSNT